jgi:hypothetical protein
MYVCGHTYTHPYQYQKKKKDMQIRTLGGMVFIFHLLDWQDLGVGERIYCWDTNLSEGQHVTCIEYSVMKGFILRK